MLNDPLLIVVVVAVLAVAGILMFGIGSFSRGGEFNRKNANKIMQARIIAQAVAVALILGFVWYRGAGN